MKIIKKRILTNYQKDEMDIVEVAIFISDKTIC